MKYERCWMIKDIESNKAFWNNDLPLIRNGLFHNILLNYSKMDRTPMVLYFFSYPSTARVEQELIQIEKLNQKGFLIRIGF